ncbi:hypothetical protein EHM94_05735 [Marinobacter sp. NP-6]|uniref:hypothetical protein n=1 Tax=Marinobacter sp. NP-6 TaxID=2488666 RepID=UPI000FCA73D1|nr:hypothetical protein [Marinobacter sp. NP-6]RUT74694.1 hypothetical protein EHM94_05735 [Marinobacter sp. NP-6]
MTDKAEDQEKSTGTAINMDELDAVEQEAGAEEQPEDAGSLMEQQDGPTTAETIQPIIDLACGVAAPNWQIQKGEREALAGAYGDLIDKYLPDGLGAWGIELNALLMTAAIFGPRVTSGVPARNQPKEEKTAEPAKEGKDADED